MKSILITGSSGFVGRNAVKLLRAAGIKVTGVDMVPAESTDVVCDIKEKRKLVEVMKSKGADAVVHLAAFIDAAESVRNPIKYIKNNTLGTALVLEAARRANVSDVIFISSVAVYGNQTTLPIYESNSTIPITPYGVSKLLAEEVVKGYGRNYGLRYTILRPSNLYGAGQNRAYAGVISKFVEAAASNTAPVLYGEGTQTRDFLHVSDMAEAIKSAAMLEGKNETYNVSANASVQIIELLRIVQEVADSKLRPKHKRQRVGDIERSEVSSDKFRSAYAWSSKVKLETGLRELLAYYKKER